MGLELSESKTKINHSSEEFDFIGFNIKQYQVKRDHFMDRNKSAKQKRF